MKKFWILICAFLMAASGCSHTKNNDLPLTIKPEVTYKNILRGCRESYKPRPLYHYTMKAGEILNPVNKILLREEGAQTEHAAEPDYEAAWEAIDIAINNCKSCPPILWAEIYHLAAIIRHMLGDNVGSINFFKKILEQSPYIPESYEARAAYSIALLLTVESDYIGALEYFDKWEELCPYKVPDSYFQDRANLHLKIGDVENAAYYMELIGNR